MAAPVLFGLVAAIVPVVVLAVAARLVGGSPGDGLIDVIAVAVLLAAAAWLIAPLSRAVLRLSLRIAPLPVGRPADPAIPPLLWISWLSVVAVLVVAGSEWITVAVAVGVGAIGCDRARRRRRRWSGMPRGRTVVFLRRFGRTADRLVSTALRRAVPRHASLVFLVGAHQGAASWDPLVVAFDGLGRGVPHYLSSTDAVWVEHVTSLVARADAVVLDASDWSDAMAIELDIIRGCGAVDRLTVLSRDDTRAGAVDGARHLRYHASWRQARDRMLGGLLLTALPAVVARDLGWPAPVMIGLTAVAVAAWALLAVRPLMDGEAAAALTRRLEALTSVPGGRAGA